MNLNGIKMTSDAFIQPVTSCVAASLGFIFSNVGSRLSLKVSLKARVQGRTGPAWCVRGLWQRHQKASRW